MSQPSPRREVRARYAPRRRLPPLEPRFSLLEELGDLRLRLLSAPESF